MKIKDEDEISKLDVLKILLERAHAEGTLLWQRNNFMFLANTALISSAFFYFFLNTSTEEAAREFKLPVSIAGLAISLIWMRFNWAGGKMNHYYVLDAKNLVKNDKVLRDIFEHSLKTPSGAAEDDVTTLERLVGPSATMLNYLFILGFIAAWIYILVTPVG